MNKRGELKRTVWILASATKKMELLFSEKRCTKGGIGLGGYRVLGDVT